ncbi:MAG: ATP-binding cassette domain-containing protein [Theionarchaea archaeon]|nr:ATP-binding cassette domain-containing protein [Theionarchaea archaeon]
MIIGRDLCFQYITSKDLVLNHVNLRVEKGDYLAVVGPSGSGKSTLCLTFNGIIPQSIAGHMTGDVTVNGLSTKEHEVFELADKVGIVLQNPESQLFAMSVEEELAFGPENLGLPREEICMRIEEASHIVGILDKERFPFSLSGGEKQKLSIASMLTMRPFYLVLDEPTSQLDPKGRKDVYAVLEELHKEGMSIILIEHDTDYVAEHAQKVIVLTEGKIIKSGSPKEVFSDVEEMKEWGVKVPEIAEFTYELCKRGLARKVYTTLEEAEGLIEDLKKSKKRKKKENGNKKEKKKRAFEESNHKIIEVKNLSFIYTDTPVLSDISFSIQKGEILALIGQNGSGKTTLVKHFNGLLRPLQGEILVDGEPVKGKSVAEMARKVGYVFQNPEHQIFADTVAEEVEFGLKNLEVPELERKLRVTQVLKQTDLYRYRDTHPTSLSGGEKQRLAIASVLVMNPDILILDEPTTGLDLKSSISIINLVKELHDQDHTVILVTHDMKLVAEMARRIIILRQGKIVAQGPPRQIFSDSTLLQENFLEEPQITRLSQMMGYGTCLTVSELLEAVEGRGTSANGGRDGDGGKDGDGGRDGDGNRERRVIL